MKFDKLPIINIYLLVVVFSTMLNSVQAQDQAKFSQTSAPGFWIEMMQDPDVNFYELKAAFDKYWESRTDYKGNGWKVYKRWEYINETRVLPDGKLQAPDFVLKEYERYKSKSGITMSASGAWSMVAPDYYPVNGTSQPTGMGRINAIAFHPTDANTIFIGAPSGGIWKTTDLGASWSDLTADLPRLGVSSIIIHPTDPDIIYIGTGDRDAADAPGIGAYKSIDGGSSWTNISGAMGNKTVGAMIMHPSDPNTIYAATSGGVYKTTNGGSSWSMVLGAGNFKDIKFKPGDPAVIYAVYISGSGARFYRSADSGGTWTWITTGNGIPVAGSRMVIGTSPANPAIVYLVQIKSADATFDALLKSTDSGLNFTTQSTSPNIFDYSCDGSGTATQSTYDLCITVDPNNANTIYVGSINNWKSSDGGVTWNISSVWAGTCSGTVVAVHADQHCFEWSPLNGNLYVGNDGGLYYTANSGTTWTEITGPLPITQIYKIGQGSAQNDMVIYGQQDNGTNALVGNNLTTIRGGDGTECAIDYSDPNYCYNTYIEGVIDRSSSGPTGSYSTIASTGTHGISADDDGAWVTPYLLHETNPGIMFAGYENVYRCNDIKASPASSVTFSAISTGETATCRVLEQSPADVNVLYVFRISATTKLQRTDNANATPASVTWTACTLPGGSNITDIEAHPTDPDIVYATAGAYIYKSGDKGLTWTDMDPNAGLPNLTINCLVYDINTDEGIYAGNQTGVWYKDATMTDWVLFSDGLPPADVRELEIFYDPVGNAHRLKAATYGRGLWQSDLFESGLLNPANFTATPASFDQIDLDWAITSGNNVMLAYNTSPSFGTPVDGTPYPASSPLPGGGTVLYNGNGNAFSQGSLSALTTYYYKIWSYDGSTLYSGGTTANARTLCPVALTPPYTQSFNNLTAPDCWSVVDNQGGGKTWMFGTISGPVLTGNYAYYNTNSNDPVNTDLISPAFDCSAYSNVALKFNHYYKNYSTSSGSVYYSIDDGDTWTLLKTYSATTLNPETATFIIQEAAGQAQVKFKWNYTASAAAWYWAIDDITVSDCPGKWNGAVSTNWHTPGNWCDNLVPAASNDVLIPAGVANMPFISSGNAACQNIIISNGATLTMSNSTARTLTVSGDWTNNGTFTPGIGTIDFNGTNSLQTVKGSSTTDFYILKVTKGAQNRILEVTALITFPASPAANMLVINNGTFKLSSASTIAPYVTAPAIWSTAGIWNNGGTINAGPYWQLDGLFKNTAGTTNFTSSLIYNGSASRIEIEGGNVNFSSRLYNFPAGTTTYSQSGGIVTVSSGSSSVPFDITSGSTFNMSGGYIVFQKAAASGATYEYRNLATTSNITGGALQIGNASTIASQTIRLQSAAPVFNLVVNATNSPIAKLFVNGLTVLKDVLISGGTLNTNNLNLTVGGNWTNNGTFTPGTGNVTFNGTISQNIDGIIATTFKDLILNNGAGAVLSGSVNASVDGVLTLTSGVISTGPNKVIITSNGSVSRTSGHIFGNLQKYIGTGTTIVRNFEIGDASAANYTPVSLTFSSVATAGNLTVKPVMGDHPDISSSNIYPDKSVNRHWILTNIGIVFTSFNAVFSFLAGDLDETVNTNHIMCGKYISPAWNYPTVGARNPYDTQVTGITTFGDIQLGEGLKTCASSGGNWSNPATWIPAEIPAALDDIRITAPAAITVDIVTAECKTIIVEPSATLIISPTNKLTVNGVIVNE